METQKICPNCRKPLPPDVPLGLCPECLIKSGFPTESGEVSGEAAAARFVPPPVEEIAPLFPQLEILNLIGKGGMGAVYQARQPALDRFVALKILPPAVAGDPGFAERFNREARALARLSHPNIVAIYDFGTVGPAANRPSPEKPESATPPVLHYLLMEFVDGTNLREIERAGKLSPEQALAIVPQICEALQFAHSEGIVHRDIKPENLLLDKKGRVKITDFGIAKIVGLPSGKPSLTGAKDVVGTPHYMAPEQIEKPQTVDHRADIYSLGVVFYEMLTGELPLGKFAPPSRKVEVDVRLDEVVLHALEKEPSRRYQQASQVKTDVETITGTPPATGAAAPPKFSAAAGLAAGDKAILPAFLLAFFFGIFGAHRFYVGRIWTGLLQLGAFGGFIFLIIVCAMGGPQPISGILLGFLIFGCVIWSTVDWILLACRAFTDGQGRRMTHWLHPQPGETKTGARPMTGPPSSPPPGGAAPPPAAAFPLPPPPAPEKKPLTGTGMIVAPAVGLMVAALWKLFSAFTALIFLTGQALIPQLGLDLNDLGLGSFSGLASASVIFFKVIPALLILFGAFQMLRLRSYAWSLAAGILAIVACSLVGLPMGIWALIVLARPDVREKFAETARSQPPRTNPWPWVGGMVLIIGLFILMALVLKLAGGPRQMTVTGTVTDAVTSKPIAGARVDDNRYGAGTDRPPQQAWTDANGRYELKTWREEHTVAASAPGYETKLDLLRTGGVDARQKARINFQLQPVPPAAASPALNLSSSNGQVAIATTNEDTARTNQTVLPKTSLKPVPATVVSPVAGQTAASPPKTPGKLTSKDPFQEDFSRTLPLSAHGRFSLDNVNGRIEIIGWDREEVAIQALKHGKTSESLEGVKINVTASPDEISVHTGESSGQSGVSEIWSWFKSGGHTLATVDYAVQVPRTARLKEISSVNGRILIKDIHGNVEASTVNGSAQIEDATGDLRLSSVNGRITAGLAVLGPGQSVDLSTVNGSIEAVLTADADADVSAGTLNGGINNEFPALAVKKEFPVGKNLKGTLGRGGARIKADSVNGSISFRQRAATP